MIKLRLSALLLVSSMCFASCGVHSNRSFNTNNNTTSVELSQNNYTVQNMVTGSSSSTYILGVGGLSNKALEGNARSIMMKKAKLKGGSRALINQTVESHITNVFPLFFRKTVTVSANVVEFK